MNSMENLNLNYGEEDLIRKTREGLRDKARKVEEAFVRTAQEMSEQKI